MYRVFGEISSQKNNEPNKEIDLVKEFDELFVKDRDRTEAILDEVSIEANEFAKFFGADMAAQYVKARLCKGHTREEAAIAVACDTYGDEHRYVNYANYRRR